MRLMAMVVVVMPVISMVVRIGVLVKALLAMEHQEVQTE